MSRAQHEQRIDNLFGRRTMSAAHDALQNRERTNVIPGPRVSRAEPRDA